MTLIVGILCEDGIVVASDSLATFAKEGVPTIGQQEMQKVLKLSDSVLFACTGSVGMGQLISQMVETSWQGSQFNKFKTPADMMNGIGLEISKLVTPYLQTANLSRPLVGDASASLCKTLIAMPVRKIPCLFTFDYNGAPEQATSELAFISLGSAQPIADPFLALLRRLLWSETQPSLAEGRLAAVWTIDHARQTNPGGVGGPIQLATLGGESSGKLPLVTVFDEKEVQEHLQQVSAAERALVEELRSPAATDQVEPIPEPPEA